MNTSLVIIVSDKTIGIGTTIISGIGTDLSIDPDLVVPNKKLSIMKMLSHHGQFHVMDILKIF